MARRKRSLRYRLTVLTAVVLGIAAAAAYGWRDDIIKAALDPKVPFVKDHPPEAPDYAVRGAWALLPAPGARSAAGVDTFFIHPPTYNGGPHWNGPIHDPGSDATLTRVMLPNYASPFDSLGDVVRAPLSPRPASTQSRPSGTTPSTPAASPTAM